MALSYRSFEQPAAGQNDLSPMSFFLHRYNGKLLVFNYILKIPKAIENAYKLQVRQQHLKHNLLKHVPLYRKLQEINENQRIIRRNNSSLIAESYMQKRLFTQT